MNLYSTTDVARECRMTVSDVCNLLKKDDAPKVEMLACKRFWTKGDIEKFKAWAISIGEIEEEWTE